MVNIIAGLMGGLLLSYGAYSAVISRSPYWYSYFVVGLFLLLDRCDARINHDANLTRLFNRNWRTPVYTYLIYLAGALFLDLFIGGYLGNMWVYPHFNLAERFLNVIVIGYPFAFFSCAALYRILNTLFNNFSDTNAQYNDKALLSFRNLGIIILFITIISTCFPIGYYLLFGKKDIQLVIIICTLPGIFSLAPLSLILGRKGLLRGILCKDRGTIMALLITILANAFAHELPNTLAWEWRYQNMPFPSLEILGVPVIVLTVGWTYLTIFGISGNELFFQ